MANRDDFSARVVLTLGQRAGYVCSNPDCRRPTAGPHSDPAKSLITGQAAHICAAAPDGPRYDASQTSEERKSISNGIWLCGGCNKKVDTDWKAWTPERLRKMKADHEQWIAAEGMIPSFPVVTLTTRTGLRLHPTFLPEITADLQAALREQELIVRNPNRVELSSFSLHLNLPEAIARDGHSTTPTGPSVRFRPIRFAGTGIVSGQGSIRAHAPRSTHQWNLEVDRLPASAEFRIAFYTAMPEFRPLPKAFKDPELMDIHRECYFYLEGTYQFVLRGEYVPGALFVPLLFRAQERVISSYPVQDSVQPWTVWSEVLGSGATLRTGGGPGAATHTLS